MSNVFEQVQGSVFEHLDELCRLTGTGSRRLKQRLHLKVTDMPGTSGASDESIEISAPFWRGIPHVTIAEESVHYFDCNVYDLEYGSIDVHRGLELIGRLYAHIVARRKQKKVDEYKDETADLQSKVERLYNILRVEKVPQLISYVEDVHRVISGSSLDGYDLLREDVEKEPWFYGVIKKQIDDSLEWYAKGIPPYSRGDEDVFDWLRHEGLPLLFRCSDGDVLWRTPAIDFRLTYDFYDQHIHTRDRAEKHQTYLLADAIGGKYTDDLAVFGVLASLLMIHPKLREQEAKKYV